MKFYKEETHTHDVYDHTVCDMCGEEVKFKYDDYMESFTLKYELEYSAWGDHWHDKSSWKVDLCNNCIDKLKKFLLDNGTKLQGYD